MLKSILEELLFRNCSVKASIVQQDEFEKGVRALLNLGHTTGHAIESALEHQVPHGICVAWGLILELDWASRRGSLSQQSLRSIKTLIEDLGFPSIPHIPLSRLLDFASKDKKRHISQSQCYINLTEIRDIADPVLTQVKLSELDSLFQPLQEISS